MARKKVAKPVASNDFAFPRSHNAPGNDGITIRDYFAAKAMQGLIASRVENRSTRFHPLDDSRYCYQIADAMLVFRDMKEDEKEDETI